jgi:hypothetical protein
MVQAYNFIASWQLFPEKGTYEYGERPRSGTYRVASIPDTRQLSFHQDQVNIEGKAFVSQYTLLADGKLNDFDDPSLAEKVQVSFPDSISLVVHFYKKGEVVLHVAHEIMPNGYLRISQQGMRPDGTTYTNTEVYHKQMSVLPYSASVAGAVIRPNEEGIIKHKALTAMEEQTNMQLDQIRQQIELLALQAHEIQKRKELSMMIYQANLSFKPNIGQLYYLYQKKNDEYMLSLVSPKEWGKGMPFKKFIAAVKLLADHTWMEV